MATLQSVLEIVFKGIDEASDVSRKISSGFDDVAQAGTALGDKISGLAEPFAGLANKVIAANAAMAGLATLIGVASVKAAADFESSLLDLQKQLEDGEGSAQSYARTLEDLALTYGQNASSLVQAMADFKAAGYSASDALMLVKNSMDFVIAGGVDAAFASEKLVAALAGFKAPASEASHILDVLNKASDITATNTKELAQGFADISPVAHLAGLSFEQTAAILTQIIDVFGSGSEAANALKSGILSLADPASEAAAKMQSLGINVSNASGKLLPLTNILQQTQKQFGFLDESQKLQAASIIFGKEQAAKMVEVIGNLGRTTDLTATLMSESAGSMEREVTIRLQSASVQFDRLGTAVQVLAVHLGEQFLTAAKDAGGGLFDLTRSFTQLIDSGAFQPFIDLINQQAESLNSLFHAIAQNLPEAFANVDFSGLLGAFGQLGDEIEQFFDALFSGADLRTVEGLSAAIQGVINTVEALVNTLSGIVDAFVPFASAAKETITHFNQLDEASKLDFGQFLGAMKAITDIGPAVAGALISIGQSGIEMGRALDIVFGVISVGINALQVAFDTVLMAITAPIAGIAAALLKVSEMAGTANSEFAGQLKDIIKFFEATAENANRNAEELKAGWNQAIGEAGQKTDDFGNRLTAAEGQLKNFGTSASETKTVIRQQVSEFDGAVSKISQYEQSMGIVVLANVKASESFKQIQKDIYALPENIKVDTYTKDIEGLVAVNDQLVVSYNQIGGGTVKATGAFKASSDAAKKQAESVDEATKKTKEWQLKMEEIASNERIKLIEAKVQLNIADLEAQAKIVEATFKSIDNTVSSTGDLLGSLFGNLKDANGVAQAEIYSQIALENKRRDEALKLQQKMTEAEIEKLNAQTNALNRGDSIIKIDGTRLAPQLEAFMWEILKAIQVRANAEFQQYLLGVT